MKISILYFVALLTGLHSISAFSYMDPGGANLFLQLVLPVISLITGFFIFLRRWLVMAFWQIFSQIKTFFRWK
jgi:hypothetical protein